MPSSGLIENTVVGIGYLLLAVSLSHLVALTIHVVALILFEPRSGLRRFWRAHTPPHTTVPFEEDELPVPLERDVEESKQKAMDFSILSVQLFIFGVFLWYIIQTFNSAIFTQLSESILRDIAVGIFAFYFTIPVGVIPISELPSVSPSFFALVVFSIFAPSVINVFSIENTTYWLSQWFSSVYADIWNRHFGKESRVVEDDRLQQTLVPIITVVVVGVTGYFIWSVVLAL
ncbi:hypothetical protein [Haloarchaeobius sp. HRN-SO-5]|uniref:hypothetical protein n=1 Tax=Haloarchaeobius sp. HRN-SO-5 TaxID=3446118 RepID=UPI003EBB8CC9